LIDHVRRSAFKLIIAIDNPDWLDDSIDDLAKVAMLVLSDEVFLSGIIAILMPTVKIWCKFDDTAIRLDSTVAIPWVCQRRLLARNDPAASSNADVLWGAMVFD
jgi:hypothetical protein